MDRIIAECYSKGRQRGRKDDDERQDLDKDAKDKKDADDDGAPQKRMAAAEQLRELNHLIRKPSRARIQLKIADMAMTNSERLESRPERKKIVRNSAQLKRLYR